MCNRVWSFGKAGSLDKAWRIDDDPSLDPVMILDFDDDYCQDDDYQALRKHDGSAVKDPECDLF